MNLNENIYISKQYDKVQRTSYDIEKCTDVCLKLIHFIRNYNFEFKLKNSVSTEENFHTANEIVQFKMATS